MSVLAPSPPASSVARRPAPSALATPEPAAFRGLSLRLLPLVLVSALAPIAPADSFPGLLAAAVFGVSIAVGAAFLAAIAGATGATWWHGIRTLPVAVARTLPIAAALLLFALVVGMPVLYSWSQPGEVASSHAVLAKRAWLSVPFFLARSILVLLVFAGGIALLRDRIALGAASRLEDRKRFGRTAVLSILLLAPATAVAFWDWTMSLEPEWFSTMYAVYGFSGAFVGGIAAVTVVALLRDARRHPTERMPAALRHDLGKMLFAFSTFWAYIWFCQYLLIWYTNIPEEVPHFVVRLRGDFLLPYLMLPALSFVVPFCALLAASVKRSPSALFQVALVILAGRILDAWLMVVPATGSAGASTAWMLAATFALVLPAGWLLFRREIAPSLT